MRKARPGVRELARLLATLAAAATILGGCGQKPGTLVYVGEMRMDLSTPITRSFEGPAKCELGPEGYNVYAAAPMPRDADLLSPDVKTIDADAVTIGVNGGLGYTASFPSANAEVSVEKDGLEGRAIFHGIMSTDGWISGVDQSIGATGTITWTCSGPGMTVLPDAVGG